ncbi:ferritin-like domain-containing protein [Dictyobacter kobayashii]|nr:ferritin-like domain-containing protein [Dictyobacter kobayashii]
MRKNDDQSLDNAKTNLIEMISAQRARRTVLKGAVAGLASLSALGTNALIGSGAVFAHGSRSKLQHILDIAVTAEQLAVTIYSNGIANATTLGISGDDLVYLQAALVEEQIHELFFESWGAQPLTSTFSYPNGTSTFTDLSTFIATQQQLEGYIASAYLAGIAEVAAIDQYRLAQILAQIACIESEHRVLGRIIIGSSPANNYAYAPVLIKQVEDVPSVLSSAGYLSPTSNNTYMYVQVSTNYPGTEYRTPYITTSNPNSNNWGYSNGSQPDSGDGAAVRVKF